MEMLDKMKKYLLIITIIGLFIMLTGCSSGPKVIDSTVGKNDSTEDTTESISMVDIPEFSSEYLVGVNVGGAIK